MLSFMLPVLVVLLCKIQEPTVSSFSMPKGILEESPDTVVGTWEEGAEVEISAS